MRWKAALLTLAIAPLQARAAVRLLVPAYFDPSTSSDWNTLISSVSASVPITAIMNPDSGPVATVDPSYTAAISSFETAGGQVVAYVHTSDGSRSISAVEQDIATYASEYPNIGGIFLDEMADTSGKLTYYKNIYSYIKSENSSWQVIGNPGTSTLSSYLAPTPAAADELVTFEDDTGYSTYTPSAWQSNFSSASFANIVYAVPDVATMQADLSQAVSDHIGNVFFSNLTGSNPYSALPSYWSQETAAISAINAPPKATYISTGSGDFNVAGNWSGAIPNAIGAEADFLGAITANHTVYSDLPLTLGTIVFNNAHSYVLAGAGALTLQAATGSAMVEAQAGTHTISLPTTLASNAIFNASAGATLIVSGPVTVNAGCSLTESGAGHIELLGSLTLQSGASANLVTGSSVQSLAVGTAAAASLIASDSQTIGAVTTQSLSLGNESSLDLRGQTLVVADGDVSALSGLVRSGMTLGEGIIDSSIASGGNALFGIGVISNASDGSTLYASFDGAFVDDTDMLVKSTLFGDTNLDGRVDGSDYARVNAGFIAGLSGWYNGDFNYDGVVDGSDFTLMDNAFNLGSSQNQASPNAEVTSSISPVPEPAVYCWMVMGWIFLWRRRHFSVRPAGAVLGRNRAPSGRPLNGVAMAGVE